MILYIQENGIKLYLSYLLLFGPPTSARCFCQDPAAWHVWCLVRGHLRDRIIANESIDLPGFGRCGLGIQSEESRQGLRTVCCFRKNSFSLGILCFKETFLFKKELVVQKCRAHFTFIFYFWKRTDLATALCSFEQQYGTVPQGPVLPGNPHSSLTDAYGFGRCQSHHSGPPTSPLRGDHQPCKVIAVK